MLEGYNDRRLYYTIVITDVGIKATTSSAVICVARKIKLAEFFSPRHSLVCIHNICNIYDKDCIYIYIYISSLETAGVLFVACLIVRRGCRPAVQGNETLVPESCCRHRRRVLRGGGDSLHKLLIQNTIIKTRRRKKTTKTLSPKSMVILCNDFPNFVQIYIYIYIYISFFSRAFGKFRVRGWMGGYRGDECDGIKKCAIIQDVRWCMGTGR